MEKITDKSITDNPFNWGGKQTDAVMKFLHSVQKNPLVAEEQLRAAVTWFPEYLKYMTVRAEGKSSRDKRTAFKAFASKWKRLSPNVQARILESYKDPVFGYAGARDFTEWLVKNTDETYGNGEREKRPLRSFVGTLGTIDDGMIVAISFLASRINSHAYMLHPEYSDGDVKIMMNSVVQAAELLGRKPIPCAQQKLCRDLSKGFTGLTETEKQELGNVFAPTGREDINLKDFLHRLNSEACSNSAKGPIPQELSETIAKLNKQTISFIIKYASYVYGWGTIKPYKDWRTMDMALFYITRAADYLSDPRAANPPKYQAGKKTRSMVIYAAWILVMVGHKRLTTPETGAMTRLLGILYYQLYPEAEDDREGWADALKNVLGHNKEQRVAWVEAMTKALSEWPPTDPSPPWPPEVKFFS